MKLIFTLKVHIRIGGLRMDEKCHLNFENQNEQETVRKQVHGLNIDAQTRCAHYHSEIDIISIKFYCCGEYYACYKCHLEEVDHPATKWPEEKWGEHAILCGNCRHELTIHEYMESSCCLKCKHAFNEKCSLHYPLYFDM